MNNGIDKLTFTFNVVEEGCGTFTDEDLTVVTGLTDVTPNITQTGDGTSTVPYLFTYTYDVNGEADGEKTITVDATDDQGNVASTLTATDAFTVDNTAPTITNVALDNSCVKNTDVITLTFDVTDVITSHCGAIDQNDITILSDKATTGTLNFEFAYQSVSTAGNVLTFTYAMTVDETNSIDDSYTVNIDVDDKAGNSATTNTDASFTVDNTKPVIQNVAYDLNCVNDADVVSLTFEVVEEGCGTFDENDIDVSESPDLDEDFGFLSQTGTGTSLDPYIFTYSINIESGDPDGDVEVSINATDDAGNDADEVVNAGAFTIDNTAPVFSNFTVTGEDGSCLAGGSTLEFTVDVVEDGCGTFNSSDINIGVAGAVVNSITADGGNPTGSGTYTFTLLIDGTDNSGDYQLAFDGTDDAGNVATHYPPPGVDFSIDNTAPIISALSVSSICVTTDEVVTITFSVEEEGCGTFNADDIELTIDDNGEALAIYTPTVNLTGGTGTNGDPYTFSATFTILSSHIDGTYDVTVTATDDAGNSDSDSDDFDVNQTPPTLSNLVTSSVPGGSPTKVGGSAPNRELTIEFDEVTDGCANFDNGTITYIITGPGNTALTVSPAAPTKSVDTWTTTVTVPSNEPSGNYQIIIIAADDNGNADTLDPAGVEFVIDNTPPQVSSVTTSHTAAGPFPPAPVLNRADDDATPPNST
ncbi:MAG: Ig-like domain-containing protein [Candidatus Kapaibacterium sp.]